MEWKEIVNAARGQKFDDFYEKGVRVIILRGGFSLCAYVGCPVDHPMAGFDYDDINLDCHGGLTFADKGTGTYLPDGYYWYGWDYSHAGDYATYMDRDGYDYSFCDGDKKWLLEDVKKEAKYVAWDFARLMKNAERIHNRAIKSEKAYPVDR